MNRKIFLPLFLLLLAQTLFSQTVPNKKEDEISAETRKQAVEFLRETAGDVGNLRSLENRISFAAEVASLMWFTDEKEARAMYQTVIGDFNRLLFEYDTQTNQMGDLKEDYSGGGGFFGGEPNEKAKLMRKVNKAIAVRQQIISSIAEHDPQLAFDFYDSSLLAISNAEMRQRFAGDSYFVARLLRQIAEKDVNKAAEYGRKSLANGINYEHLELVRKIYAKDADKGAEFAEEIAKKFKDQKTDIDGYYLLASFLRLGADNYEKAKKDNKKPMLTEQTLRDLSEILAQTFLKGDETAGMEYIGIFEKFAPSRAIQIRAKNSSRTQPAGNRVNYPANAAGSPAIGSRPVVVETGVIENPEISTGEKLAKDLANLQNKELPKEEREKVIAKARKIISELPGKQAKLLALTGLAAQVYKLGDKDLANELMRDAQGLVNLQPKNFQEYLEVWFLINGYAQSDAEKAFPILEDTLTRVNETLNAFIKVAEFIDVQGEIVDDDEVQVGAFGGSLIREITGGLGQTDGVLRNLAKTDFARTKALTNRFDKPEIRVLAKMLVLRAVFGDVRTPENTDEGTGIGF